MSGQPGQSGQSNQSGPPGQAGHSVQSGQAPQSEQVVPAGGELPWHGEYRVFGIPKTLEPYSDRPVHDLLTRAAAKYRKSGLVQMNHTMTYPQVKDHVDRLATALSDMGLKKGDRVASLLPTSIQFVVVEYALSTLGLVHVPGSSLEPLSILEHKFSEAGPRALFALDEHLDLAKKLQDKAGLDFVILSKLAEYSDRKPEHSRYPEVDLPGTVWMKDLIARHQPQPPHVDFDVEKDLQLLLFTGGTTGLPKGCMLTHRNIYANAAQSVATFGLTGRLVRGAIAALVGLPFFHSYGHMVMHTLTQLGITQLLVPDARDTEAMVQMIREHHPVLQFGVPTQFMKLAETDLAKAGVIGVSGSAPLSESTRREFQERTESSLIQGYGLSEMSPNTHLNTTALSSMLGSGAFLWLTNFLLRLPGVAPSGNLILRLLGSKIIGRIITSAVALLAGLKKRSPTNGADEAYEREGAVGIPMPDTEVKLLDVDSGRELTWEETLAGKSGEMCLRGPQRMLGYWPEVGSGIEPDGFIKTGDVVSVDEKGYFYIVDRTKDMINISGFKVYSREIDELLADHPKAEMGAAVGIPDPEREGSERVVVFVQPRAQYVGKISDTEIIEYLESKVAKYAVPKIVRFVADIPLTEVQKIDKKALRRMAQAAAPELAKK